MLLPIATVSPSSTTTRAILKRYLVVRTDPQAQITFQQQLCRGNQIFFAPENEAVAENAKQEK
jgi:hypothetical protein